VSRHRPGPLTPEVNSASGHVRNRHTADGYPGDADPYGQAYQVTPYNVAETTPQPAVPDPASTRKVAVRRVTPPPALREVDRRDRGDVAGREETGPRASRRITRQRRSVIHRLGTTGQVGAAAVIFVAAAAVAVYFVAPGSSGAGGAAAFEAISNSNTLTALEKERQEIVDMNAAAQTMSVTGKMNVVSPSQVVESEQEASEQSTSQDETSDAPSEPTGPTPDPGSAEAIGYDLLPSYGFSQSTQWGCLYDLWMRESGWVYDAENASGAYGVPQSLPASKMASAGSDYLTDPRTQIIWGLGYIQSTYGTPCDAWDFEEANGYY
jgi:hypothetical protein